MDVGCGLGTFLHVFKEHGVSKVLGLDGPWANKTLMSQFLSEGEFMECDLQEEIELTYYYDLVLSLEVAEHLSPDAADVFVKNLVKAGKLIVFSAAIPLQGGQNHINEQWNSYWIEKFSKHGYVPHDILRPVFWNNPKIFWWYKQNMLLFAPEGFQPSGLYQKNVLKNVVHPELFTAKAKGVDDLLKKIERIKRGELPTLTYVKLCIRSVFGNGNMELLKNIFKPKARNR